MGTPDPTSVEPTSASPMPAPGQALGPYKVIEKIAEGRSGVVYRVRHSQRRTTHVLKVLRRRDPEVEARLRVEVEVQQRLRHPNAVPFTGVVEAEGCFGVVIDAVEAPRLRHILAEGHGMAPEEALPLMAEMLAGVNAAHRVGVLHLGLTPDVVRLVTLPERVCPRVCDFGLAGALQSRPEGDSGGARYIAPELMENPAGGSTASDVFSLGVMFYEMLAGVPPFWGQARPGGPGGLPAEVKPVGRFAKSCPDGVAAALHRALQWRPDDRYYDCEAFARGLFGDEFVLFDEDDVTDADQFDPRPEPTRPRPTAADPAASAGDPHSQPLLTDILSGKVVPSASPGRPSSSGGEAGPPIIVGRTLQGERRAAGAKVGTSAGSAPSGQGETPLAAVTAAALANVTAWTSGSAPAVGAGATPGASEAGTAIAILQGAVNVESERAASERAAAIEEMRAPPHREVRLAQRAFQFVIAPLVLIVGIVAAQSGWAGYRLGQARAQAAFASATVDARLAEAFEDADRLIAQGSPAASIQAAVDEGRVARDLPARAEALGELADVMKRAVQVLPATTSPDALLERRVVSKSVDALTVDLELHLAAASELQEAEAAPLAGLGEALGFADGRPFGQEIPALRPQARLVAAVDEE